MKKFTKGFSLIEMTIVLLIVGIMLGMLKSPLSQVLENRRMSENELKIKETQKILDAIQDNLMGYILVNQKLPCPAKTIELGVSDSTLCASEGYLPYKELGFQKYKDSWGSAICYRVDQAFTSTITINSKASNNIDLQDASGTTLLPNITDKPYPILILYSTGYYKTSCNASQQPVAYKTNAENLLVYMNRYNILYYLAKFNLI